MQRTIWFIVGIVNVTETANITVLIVKNTSEYTGKFHEAVNTEANESIRKKLGIKKQLLKLFVCLTYLTVFIQLLTWLKLFREFCSDSEPFKNSFLNSVDISSDLAVPRS